jgi:hypothetical protein
MGFWVFEVFVPNRRHSVMWQLAAWFQHLRVRQRGYHSRVVGIVETSLDIDVTLYPQGRLADIMHVRCSCWNVHTGDETGVLPRDTDAFQDDGMVFTWPNLFRKSLRGRYTIIPEMTEIHGTDPGLDDVESTCERFHVSLAFQTRATRRPSWFWIAFSSTWLQ